MQRCGVNAKCTAKNNNGQIEEVQLYKWLFAIHLLIPIVCRRPSFILIWLSWSALYCNIVCFLSLNFKPMPGTKSEFCLFWLALVCHYSALMYFFVFSFNNKLSILRYPANEGNRMLRLCCHLSEKGQPETISPAISKPNHKSIENPNSALPTHPHWYNPTGGGGTKTWIWSRLAFICYWAEAKSTWSALSHQLLTVIQGSLACALCNARLCLSCNIAYELMECAMGVIICSLCSNKHCNNRGGIGLWLQ